MERWAGRVALVTGASSGIGAAIATALVKHKMTVIGCGRQVDRIQSLAAELKSNMASSSDDEDRGSLEALRCDLRDETEIQKMFEIIRNKHAGLDVCVNAAGLLKRAPLLSGSTDDWREMLQVNVLALSVMTREAVSSMRHKGINDGQVINISSMSGHRSTRGADTAFYGATKCAVRALTEGVRAELRQEKSQIRIAEISPGMVETELFSRAGGQQYSDRLFKNLKALEPNDIAESVIYILSAPPNVQVHDILMRSTDQIS